MEERRIYRIALEAILGNIDTQTNLLISWNAHLNLYAEGSLASRIAQAALDRVEFGPAPSCYSPLHGITEAKKRWPKRKTNKGGAGESKTKK